MANDVLVDEPRLGRGTWGRRAVGCCRAGLWHGPCALGVRAIHAAVQEMAMMSRFQRCHQCVSTPLLARWDRLSYTGLLMPHSEKKTKAPMRHETTVTMDRKFGLHVYFSFGYGLRRIVTPNIPTMCPQVKA